MLTGNQVFGPMGIYNNGLWEGGIWYNGIFNGKWIS
jgi:hypothetical protein